MSDCRLPDIILKKRVPAGDGRKSLTFELFLAYQFRLQIQIGKRNAWPVPPARREDRIVYDKTLYRVRFQSRWQGSKSKYQFFSLSEVGALVEEVTETGDSK